MEREDYPSPSWPPLPSTSGRAKTGPSARVGGLRDGEGIFTLGQGGELNKEHLYKGQCNTPSRNSGKQLPPLGLKGQMEGALPGTWSEELSREGHLTEAMASHRQTEPILSDLAGRAPQKKYPNLPLPAPALLCCPSVATSIQKPEGKEPP